MLRVITAFMQGTRSGNWKEDRPFQFSRSSPARNGKQGQCWRSLLSAMISGTSPTSPNRTPRRNSMVSWNTCLNSTGQESWLNGLIKTVVDAVGIIDELEKFYDRYHDIKNDPEWPTAQYNLPDDVHWIIVIIAAIATKISILISYE